MTLDQQLENDLLAKNLKWIDRLNRRQLKRFLDKETTKDNTKRLRAKARLVAIDGDGVEVNMDLDRAQGWDNAF